MPSGDWYTLGLAIRGASRPCTGESQDSKREAHPPPPQQKYARDLLFINYVAALFQYSILPVSKLSVRGRYWSVFTARMSFIAKNMQFIAKTFFLCSELLLLTHRNAGN